jgi:hypothetical protein
MGNSLDVEFDGLLRQVAGHSFWLSYLADAARLISPVGIHVAIFSEPFLTLVLSGRKTVESRFSRSRCAPYGEIDAGDIILIKEVAGPICGITLAKRTWHYDLLTEPIARIKNRFAEAICADDEFWSSRSDALYATLIELDATATIDPVWFDKRDRRGWVSLRSRQLAFDFI